MRPAPPDAPVPFLKTAGESQRVGGAAEQGPTVTVIRTSEACWYPAASREALGLGCGLSLHRGPSHPARPAQHPSTLAQLPRGACTVGGLRPPPFRGSVRMEAGDSQSSRELGLEGIQGLFPQSSARPVLSVPLRIPNAADPVRICPGTFHPFLMPPWGAAQTISGCSRRGY